jgi:hypothetical protein
VAVTGWQREEEGKRHVCGAVIRGLMRVRMVAKRLSRVFMRCVVQWCRSVILEDRRRCTSIVAQISSFRDMCDDDVRHRAGGAVGRVAPWLDRGPRTCSCENQGAGERPQLIHTRNRSTRAESFR